MAAFTHPSDAELTAFLKTYGLDKYDEFQAIAGGSVNSNFSVDIAGTAYFLRIYEEQDAHGAGAELEMVAELARRGVRTPVALLGARTLAGKPAALFPWVSGTIRCQRAVSARDVTAIGSALAKLHAAGSDVHAGDGRFHPDALVVRLQTIDPSSFPVERLRRTLEALVERTPAVPRGLIHGDLFRDNVLWDGEKLASLLDFESASRGAFVYDLAVTMLAWCYGDGFSTDLLRALVVGYESVRRLDESERHAFHAQTRLAALRFTITRITDYAMRASSARVAVMKDWRRFLARLDAIEALSDRALLELSGL